MLRTRAHAPATIRRMMGGMQNTYLFVGLAVVVFIPLAASIVGMVATIIRLRRDPPLAEIIARDYATKAELKAIEARVAADLASIRREHAELIGDFRRESRETDGEIFNLIRSYTASTTKALGDVEKSLSRIEGKLEHCPGPLACAKGGL